MLPILSHMFPHRILIAGGGIAALEAAVALHTLGGGRLDLFVISPDASFSFRAQQVREPFGGPMPLALPLVQVLEGIAEHIQDTVTGVDPRARVVSTAGGRELAYDSLMICVGGTPFPAFAHGITFDRPTDPAAFEDLLDDVAGRLASDVAFIVPEADGWALPAYDLALLLRTWARDQRREVGIRILTAEGGPLAAFGSGASKRVAEVLAAADIEIVCGSEPVLISDTAVLAGGRWMTADRIVSLPRLAGPRLRGVPCNWEGFVEVDADGRVPGLSGVFAVGDGAAHRRKQGGLAAQQADHAARVLLREAGIDVPDSPDPQMLRGVLATPDGPLFLQAGLGYGAPGTDSIASLQPLWDPPSKVVTRWLGPHLDGLVRRRTAAFTA